MKAVLWLALGAGLAASQGSEERAAGAAPVAAAPDSAPAEAPRAWPSEAWIEAVEGAEAIAFSPDGRWLAVGTSYGEVALLDASGALERSFAIGSESDAEPEAVFALAFAPDGARLVAGTSAGRLWVFGLAEGEGDRIVELGPVSVVDVEFSPDGEQLAIGAIHELGWVESEDGESAYDYESWVLLWDPTGAATEERAGWVLAYWLEDLAWSPDGKTLAIADETAEVGFIAVDTQQFLAGWSAAAAGDVPPAIQSLAWSPDGSRLACGDELGRIHLVAFEGRRTLAVAQAHAIGVLDLEFTPDGARLASASEDATAKLWDAAGESLACRAVLAGHLALVADLDVHPSGEWLASAGYDEVVLRFELAAAQPAAALPAELTEPIDLCGATVALPYGLFDYDSEEESEPSEGVACEVDVRTRDDSFAVSLWWGSEPEEPEYLEEFLAGLRAEVETSPDPGEWLGSASVTLGGQTWQRADYTVGEGSEGLRVVVLATLCQGSEFVLQTFAWEPVWPALEERVEALFASIELPPE